ncbi:radical SAM protein [Clostridiales bacterium BX7]|uniref:Radical SAM protein n=1 Tax=Feifania hominis TaxID=2763660 RepID=A0A926DBS2_9FIRM|nr:radical SAM protein [Feifania hominis]
MELVAARSIVTRNKGGADWFGCDYNMNIYRGCCHGCIYCDSRSDCYGIEDFDRVRAKRDALRIIRDDLSRKLRPGVVATGAMSDPYNPFERELLLTRHALELIDAYGFGAAIATKSDLIVRDADVLREIARHSPVLCKFTITTADDALCAKIEPRVTNSTGRFKAVERLSAEGLFCGILLMPVLPFLEDSEENVLALVRRAAQCGARFIYPAFGMTLRQNQREWYYCKLEEQFPGQGLRERYERRYGGRYRCTSPRARELYAAFAGECDRLGIAYRMRDIVALSRLGYGEIQLSLFDR